MGTSRSSASPLGSVDPSSGKPPSFASCGIRRVIPGCSGRGVGGVQDQTRGHCGVLNDGDPYRPRGGDVAPASLSKEPATRGWGSREERPGGHGGGGVGRAAGHTGRRWPLGEQRGGGGAHSPRISSTFRERARCAQQSPRTSTTTQQAEPQRRMAADGGGSRSGPAPVTCARGPALRSPPVAVPPDPSETSGDPELRRRVSPRGGRPGARGGAEERPGSGQGGRRKGRCLPQDPSPAGPKALGLAGTSGPRTVSHHQTSGPRHTSGAGWGSAQSSPAGAGGGGWPGPALRTRGTGTLEAAAHPS